MSSSESGASDVPACPAWQWTAVQTAQAIRSGSVSCREVVESHVARLEEVGHLTNSIVVDLHESSLALATKMDAKRSRHDSLPALFGVPVTIKINVDVEGQANSDGVAAYSDVIAQADAPVVANLKRDGAIILGLTNTPEFSIRWFTSNPLHGHTLNPWSDQITPGGSSGAAAASVASGIGCITHGNDMGGSVRYPAYCCGVATIRPSMGRIANGNPTAAAGRPPISQLVSVQGPLARTVSDVRLGLHSMARRSAFDADWTPAKDSGRGKHPPFKVAYCEDLFGDGVSDDVRVAMRKARAALEDAGHIVVDTGLPSAVEGAEIWGQLIVAELDALAMEEMRRHGTAETMRVVDGLRDFFGGSCDLETAMRAMMARTRIRREWSMLLESYDLVLMPVSAERPFPDQLDFEQPAELPRIFAAQRYLYLVNLLGFPAATVPTNLTEDRVPMGVQIVGAPFDDDLCLDAAQDIEDRCGTLSQDLWRLIAERQG